LHSFLISDQETDGAPGSCRRADDGRSYEVRVYQDRRAYLRAIRRRWGDEDNRDSHATTFHERRWSIGPDGSEVESPIVGLICLHAEMVDAEVISHEATHAALRLWRIRHRGTANLGHNVTDRETEREEELACSIGRLTQAIAEELWARKVWKGKGGHA